MTTATPAELDDIVARVRDWEPASRALLARKILDTLPYPTASAPSRRLPIEHMFGLLKTDGPAPTDAEVKAILEEERLKKWT